VAIFGSYPGNALRRALGSAERGEARYPRCLGTDSVRQISRICVSAMADMWKIRDCSRDIAVCVLLQGDQV